MLLEVFVQALLLLPLLREILVPLRPVKRYHRKRNIKRESVCEKERVRERERERERDRETDRDRQIVREREREGEGERQTETDRYREREREREREIRERETKKKRKKKERKKERGRCRNEDFWNVLGVIEGDHRHSNNMTYVCLDRKSTRLNSSHRR